MENSSYIQPSNRLRELRAPLNELDQVQLKLLVGSIRKFRSMPLPEPAKKAPRCIREFIRCRYTRSRFRARNDPGVAHLRMKGTYRCPRSLATLARCGCP